MSRLYIKDLERIVNGELQRCNFGEKTSNSLVSLDKINNEIKESRYLRNYIVEEFKNDIKKEFDILRGSRIEREENVELNLEKLFNHDYLEITIPTILGDTLCLLSSNDLIASTSSIGDLDEKLKVIRPYVKKLFDLKKETHILDNEFYQDVNIFDDEERVLVMHGGGILLPFRDYKDLTKENLQDLLSYYYKNWNTILKNILVYNDQILERFKPDITKEKALGIYKG